MPCLICVAAKVTGSNPGGGRCIFDGSEPAITKTRNTLASKHSGAEWFSYGLPSGAFKLSGTIVNIYSVASTVTVRNLTAYSITKAALDKLTRMTAFENASYGVRVNAINPGVIKTTFGMNPENNVQEHLKSLEEMAGGAHALGRIGRPEEVARCIAFLASEEASFITGIMMPVDGGLSLLYTFTGPNPWHK